MKLSALCKSITQLEPNILADDEKMAHRLVCPEYSVDNPQVKTFPDLGQDEIFILCWNMDEKSRLNATIKPSKKPFTYSCSFQSGEKTQYHTHDYIELAYVVEGVFQQRILGKDIQFKQGELCLIDKNCLHQDYLYQNHSTILFIGLANEFFDKIMVENIEEERILGFLQTALLKQKDIQQYVHFKPKNPGNRRLEALLTALIKELECNDEASKYICKGIMIRLLHLISTEYEFRLSNEQRKKMNWLIFEEIIKYITEHYNRITIKDLVAKFHFNEDYYNRLLKEKYGMTYSDYVQNLRLKNARKLLKTTNMTVDEVAEQVGYHNKGYFYKIFVEKYAITPAKLRKQTGNSSKLFLEK